MALIHRHPERNWTMASLAKAAGMSRSPFYTRFKRRVGEPPLAYLTRWRIHLAGRYLEEGKSVAESAALVGYASEAAFSTAFKRMRNMTQSAVSAIANADRSYRPLICHIAATICC